MAKDSTESLQIETLSPGKFDLTVDHGLQSRDALILAITAENRCRMLLSEDMQHGFTWRGVTVVNPYQIPTHPLLSSLLL